MKNYIVCIAKNEDEYLEEWIQYHLNLGFDAICIYDNNIDDHLKNLDYIQKYVNNGQVEIINAIGKTQYQFQAYNDFLSVRSFNWALIIDCDEFLVLDEKYKNNIKLFLNEYDYLDVIYLNWMLYGSNREIYKRPGKVQDRFPNPMLPIYKSNGNKQMFGGFNAHIKSLIKGNINVKYIYNPHSIKLYDNNIKVGTTNGEIKGELCESPWQPINFKNAYIKHYRNKSREEYLFRKSYPTADGCIMCPDDFLDHESIEDLEFWKNHINDVKI